MRYSNVYSSAASNSDKFGLWTCLSTCGTTMQNVSNLATLHVLCLSLPVCDIRFTRALVVRSSKY